MKWLIRIALVVVLLVVALAVVGVVMIDSIATTAVSKGAAFATQTDADCEKVDVKLIGSGAEIVNLDIKNPDGPFRDTFDSFLKLGTGTAEVSAGSVLSDKIEIPKVELSDIEISLVGLDDGTKNYEAILEALKRFQGDAPPKETESEKQVVINELVIRNITVKYDFAKDPALGALPVNGTVVIADKEPMILTNVGGDGSPMSQITADIISDILVQVTANLADDLGNHVLGLTGSLADTLGVGQLKETLGELGLDGLNVDEQLKRFEDLGGEVQDKVDEALDGARDQINDLIGGDNEDGDGGGIGNVLDRGRGLLGGDDE